EDLIAWGNILGRLQAEASLRLLETLDHRLTNNALYYERELKTRTTFCLKRNSASGNWPQSSSANGRSQQTSRKRKHLQQQLQPASDGGFFCPSCSAGDSLADGTLLLFL